MNARVKRWMQTRQKHYKQATGEYVIRLRQALDKNFKQNSSNLRSNTIIVHIEPAGEEKKTIQGLTIVRRDLPEAKLNQRIKLIKVSSSRQVASGIVTKVRLHEVCIRLNQQLNFEDEKKDDAKPTTTTTTSDSLSSTREENHYKIEFDLRDLVENKVKVERALRKFSKLSCSLPLHKCLLGNYKDCSNSKYGKARVVPLEGLISPKGLQVLAVEQSMKKRISLIEGVAGSGKTLVAANIACSMSRLRKRKVLLCSPVQATVDRLARMISITEGVYVVKFSSDRVSVVEKVNKQQEQATEFETSSDELDNELSYELKANDCSLEKLIDESIYRKGWLRLKRQSPNFGATRKERAQMHQRTLKMVKNSSPWLRSRLAYKILQKADVVCCTVAQAGDKLLRGLHFDMLIIDDAQMASELESLIPMMVKGLKQVTFLSDMHQEIRLAQANGIVASRKSSRNSSFKGSNSARKTRGHSLFTSLRTRTVKNLADVKLNLVQKPGGLFERLLVVGLAPVPLKYQFRMHETLAAFPNQCFYLSRLKTDATTNEKLSSEIRDSSEKSKEKEESDGDGDERKFSWLLHNKHCTAIFNIVNESDTILEKVRDILDKLVKLENVHESKIGIISSVPKYAGQRIHGVKIGTIEDFVGQEKDFIILLAAEPIKEEKKSTLNDSSYMKNDHLLHVALTRARLGLFILTDLTYVEPVINPSQTTTLNRELDPPTDYCRSWQNLVKYYRANELVM